MDSLSTLPRRTWLERATVALAGLLVAVGAVTLLGWWLHVDELLQWRGGSDSWVPMTANSAFAFTLLGAVLLCVEFGKRRVATLAAAAIVIGLATLFENISGQALQIDELLVRDHLMVGTDQPGRMSAMIAACLALAGISLAWRAFERQAQARLFAEAVTGSILSAVGFSTLLGWVVGLPRVYTWGTDTATPPAAAICLLLLGTAIILVAWRGSIKSEGGPPSWTPMPAVIGCLTLTVILWVGLRNREKTSLEQRNQTSATQLGLQINNVLEQQQAQIERLARNASWQDTNKDGKDPV